MDNSREPRIYLLPNLMTAGNLCCGFFAVLTIFQGMQAPDFGEARIFYERALLLIFGSCLFDLLDGRLARLGGHDSPFGREFDSLADLVSFGMAPALLLSKAVLFNLELPPTLAKAEPGVGWAIAFVYLLCGAMRLARFNCLAAEGKGDDSEFRGIPIPMAAGFIASLTFLIIYLYNNDRELGAWSYVLALVMLALAWLMISDVRYPSFKGIGWRTRANLPVLLLVAVLVTALIRYYWFLPAVLFSLYLLYGLVRPWISTRWRKGVEGTLEEQLEGADLQDSENSG
ncbi:MAG: CDP-diacylglycerol--serine O-phosphatidyltransferase [Akkermansiaceae bacterium]|nr:CDP-diacylglycerol--serine O-phosphatidyltransferase [Akkermansiaceae bacterium]NNM30008.1 CDP-diacylglycerol--serine O-phosphatidyltransferase [Akkermansiaceae bacterium]